MVVTGKPFVFAAGADITEFPKVRDRETAIEGSRAGHDLFGRIRALPYPTVAAINGACLGGGLEISLHCSARTISTSVRHFGFPEVFLGIIPGWGGTQLAPQLIGPAQAVKLIVENPLRQNRMLDGAKAFERGLADRLLEPVEFVDESIAYALELVEGGLPERAEPDWSGARDRAPPRTDRRRRRRPRRRAGAVRRDRPDRGRRKLDARGGLQARGGGDRRPDSLAPGAGVALRVRPRRAPREARGRDPGREAAPGAEGRDRRRRPDGDPARDPLPATPRGADRDARHRCRARGIRARGRARRTAREPLRRGQAPLPRLARHRLDGAGRVRGLRLRARGGVRGARGEEAGLRRARGDRLARVHLRHEYLVALGDRDGRGPRASRAARRDALLQPRGDDAPARADPHSRDRRHHARDRLGPLAKARQARRARRGRARLRRQPGADADDARADGRDRARLLGGGHRRGDPPARDADGTIGAAADGRAPRRQPRARDAARGVPGPLPALAGARGLRRGSRRACDRRACTVVDRGDPGARNGRSRGRDPAHARRGRRRGGGRRRHVPAARCRLAVFMGGATRYLDQTGVSERLFGRPFAEAGAKVVA